MVGAASITLVFNGSPQPKTTIRRAAGRRFSSDLGAITMHLDSVERIELNPLGGADNTIVT